MKEFFAELRARPDLNPLLAYTVCRLTLGLNIFIHGINKVFDGPENFFSSIRPSFEHTILPLWAVHVFAWLLPFFETFLGLLITVGLLTRWSLMIGGLLMTLLVFGTAVRNESSLLGVQMVYVIVYFELLRCLSSNPLSFDYFTEPRPAPDYPEYKQS